jgi:geranylgeranyl diphosphate synthase type I
MRAALDLIDPASAAMAAYHLGLTNADGDPLDVDGGKSLRPTLALLSARAAGADEEAGIAGAVGVELVHNFSLIHDDVMDRDAQRRHRPTVWAVWGVPSAILAGDAMLVAAHRVVLDSGSPHAAAASLLLLDATGALIGGQAQDLDFEGRVDVTVTECREMIAGKTGALLSASAAIGAVLAGGSERLVQALSTYGAHLGMAFQFVDDLLGIWGDPAVTGKPVLSDLRSRKKSLPVAYALSVDDVTAEELGELLGKSELSDDELDRAARLVEGSGARDWVRAEAEREAAAAAEVLAPLQDDGVLDADVSSALGEIASFVVARHK